jgi:hypothetical protein
MLKHIFPEAVLKLQGKEADKVDNSSNGLSPGWDGMTYY